MRSKLIQRFLASLPIDIEAGESSDGGVPIVLRNPEAEISFAVSDIARQVSDLLEGEGRTSAA